MFRKILFWSHLCSGIAVGIVVFTMSFTGVLLTYQRQIEQWAAQRDYVPAGEQGARLPLEELIRIQRSEYPDSPAASLTISNDPGAPVEFRAGRQGGVSLNPYTGARMELGSPGLSGFFSAVTGFHRWFNISGENRALARQITGVSNVAFLFLLLSGMYLWLPKLWRWAQFKARLLLRGSYPDGKARDFHWHHIFGIWSALPLLAVVYTGAVISYPWAANFMYRVFGAEMAPVAALAADVAATNTAPAAAGLPLDALVQKALAHSGEGWKRVNLSLPRAEDDAVR
ncbi:MAG: PepSY domain-containing protein, partial [Pseudomonadales bacterium]|nr:PepSY domain-containing protein [Pseudomonadales bacterium]